MSSKIFTSHFSFSTWGDVQNLQIRCSKGVALYLPVSISRLCADNLNLHKAFLNSQLLIQLRYVSVCKEKNILERPIPVQFARFINIRRS